MDGYTPRYLISAEEAPMATRKSNCTTINLERKDDTQCRRISILSKQPFDIEGDIKRLLGKDADAPTLGIILSFQVNSSTIRFACGHGSLFCTYQISWRISIHIKANKPVDVRSVKFRSI